MAETSTRQDKVAAGLKKLKQFQQRANKKSVKKKGESPDPGEEGSSENIVKGDVISKPLKEFSSSTEELRNIQEFAAALTSRPKDSQSLCHSEISASSDQLNIETTNLSNSSPSRAKSKSDLEVDKVRELSSTESLWQISQQINGLMSETHAFLNGEVEPNEQPVENQTLERRNLELAALVDNYKQSNEHLQFQLQELKAKISRLQREGERGKQELQEKSHKEQVTLKDQLQVHIQTIGILVAEKTELQSSLSLSQQTAKQKAGEVEELQGRLRASRQRVADLERELNNLSSSSQQFEKNNKEYSKDIDRLKIENYKLSKSSEEVKQQNSELLEKLNKKMSDNQELERQLADVRSKLAMSELYVQQLSNSSNPDNSHQLEDLHQEKLELEKKMASNKETIDRLTAERDQMAEHYQTYVQQLSQQITSLRDELKQASEEKNSILKERTEMQKSIETLSQAQNSQSIQQVQMEEIKQDMDKILKEKEELHKEYETQINDNAQMSRLVEEQESKIVELESTLNRMKEEEVDKSSILETMQSDKLAASRAMTQNRELKRQLEELQNGFVKMSNDKLEMVEKLHHEQYITKELGERLSQQEEELQELRDQLTEKEQHLRELEKSSTKDMYQQNLIADRMRHFEAQGQLTEMLQQELAQAQERANALVGQNTDLRLALTRQAEELAADGKGDRDSSKRNDLVASLSASVRQLEMERDQLMRQLEQQQSQRTSLKAQMKEMKENQINQGDADVVPKEDYFGLKKSMNQLEDRFKQTMNQIADLTDQKQQLEHVVTQLQGETDTIGDYIALYQVQRGIMRKRAAEKDDYIAQLARDREDLKSKLGELQDLVMRLLEERKQFQLDEHISLNGSDTTVLPNMENNKPLKDKNELLSRKDGEMAPVSLTETSAVPVASIPDESTAKKIMDLLTEIETSNLVEKPVSDNFHPCPLCSGRLITV